jgi:hypothetical protein
MSFAQRKAFYEGVDGWVEIWETWQVATGWRDYRGSGGHPSAIEEESQGVTSLLLKRNRIAENESRFPLQCYREDPQERYLWLF